MGSIKERGSEGGISRKGGEGAGSKKTGTIKNNKRLISGTYQPYYLEVKTLGGSVLTKNGRTLKLVRATVLLIGCA